MWKQNEQHVTSVWDKEKIWVHDRIQTYDLPNTVSHASDMLIILFSHLFHRV